MSNKPILFSAPMVRAILAGTKTQTRRIVKFEAVHGHSVFTYVHPHPCGGYQFSATDRYVEIGGAGKISPYGIVGDRLWVREAHVIINGECVYSADYETSRPFTGCKWKPSIFMRPQHSRITLEITGISVERLQEISEADCYAEGITDEDVGIGLANAAYLGLWDRINGKGAAAKNPWVWVIEFKRVK